ncbi:MAG TPA: hypothetical protein VNF75_04785 [Candidatus Dormibacteraeota bacterium]|nr:hypothetical protein [Candidatus Dormibacteraeota bacterium]
MTAGALAGPGALTSLLAAGTVLVAQLSSRSTSRTVAGVLALALVSAVLTALLVVDPYPWSNVLVLGVAWSGGILYGRVPGRWFAGLLIVLALLDLASFASGVQSQGGPSPSASPNFVSNLTVLWTGGHFREGILDIAVLVGTAARWTRTWRPGTVLVLALLAALAPSGLVAAGWRGGLPLVPFMAAVYASSVVVTRWRARHGGDGRLRTRPGPGPRKRLPARPISERGWRTHPHSGHGAARGNRGRPGASPPVPAVWDRFPETAANGQESARASVRSIARWQVCRPVSQPESTGLSGGASDRGAQAELDGFLRVEHASGCEAPEGRPSTPCP